MGIRRSLLLLCAVLAAAPTVSAQSADSVRVKDELERLETRLTDLEAKRDSLQHLISSVAATRAQLLAQLRSIRGRSGAVDGVEVTLRSNSVIRAEPRFVAKEVRRLDSDESVTVVDVEGEYVLVADGAATSGWTRSTNIKSPPEELERRIENAKARRLEERERAAEELREERLSQPGHRLYVHGSANAVSITYGLDGNTEQIGRVTLPHIIELGSLSKNAFVYISAQNQGGEGTVIVEVIKGIRTFMLKPAVLGKVCTIAQHRTNVLNPHTRDEQW